jgi:hypothetical protein
MPKQAIISKSKAKGKKYKILLVTYKKGQKPKFKTLNIGQAGASDFTIHKDTERRERYLNRHRARENWKKSGWQTAGFWARWLLWNKPTLKGSANYIKSRFGIRVKINL